MRPSGARPRPLAEGPGGAPILVTGGTGFLGRAVVAQLRAAGYAVRSMQRGPVSDGSCAVAGDVRDPAAVDRAVQGAEAAVHAAGLAHVFRGATAAALADVNERGTDVLARAAVAAGVRHLVLVSSVAVYGSARSAREEDDCRPITPYGVSKAAAERRAIAAVGGTATRLTILRLATLYGEGDRGNVQRLLSALERGRFAWVGRGANRKTLLHVGDAARACMLALAAGGDAVEVYNVAAPPVAMRGVVEGLAQALGRRVPSWRVPLGLARAAATVAGYVAPARGRAIHEALDKWSSDDVYPGDKFARRSGFEPHVSLAEGLARQVAWSRSSNGDRTVC